MRKKIKLSVGPGIEVEEIELRDGRRVLSARAAGERSCPVCDNAILRQLKRHVRERADTAPLRAIAIDDWSWRKGFTYGAIIVDLERRTVADVMETRSAKETADWLTRRPEIENVSRDRCGLYAQGIRQGAPQARQVADWFHLLQNLREAIERQMTAVAPDFRLPRATVN